MRKIERLLIAAGVIFFASYIIHLPMCNQDYLRKGSIRLAEDMCKHSTLSQSIKEVLRTNDIVENIENLSKTNFIFAKVKVIFEIANIPVYHWQLARGNLNASRFIGLVGRYNKNRCSNVYFPLSGHILYCRQ
nr:MAG TPA: hypothetical protein [Bacteriophage sp.]